MSFTISASIKGYLFPADKDEGLAAFLDILHNPVETYIIAYGFTMSDLVDEIIAAHNESIPVHLYLDHSQSAGQMEKPLVQKLVDAGVDVTIGTSASGKKYICHAKGVVTVGGSVWEGSVNFSSSGWYQVNTAMQFESPEYTNQFISMFEALRQYAWSQEANLQLAKTETPSA